MPNYIYIAATIDGFIADKNGGIDWLTEIPNPDNSDFGFKEFMEKIDGIIMGRKTFEKVLRFDEWAYSKKVFVLSDTLKTIPENLGDNIEIVQGKLTSILSRLNSKGYKNLYIDGGKTIQSFLREDLIDEMIITRVSILLGDGIPLFGLLDKSIQFEAVSTEILNDFLVKTHYKKR
jgi:dihydrofolate reductase